VTARSRPGTPRDLDALGGVGGCAGVERSQRGRVRASLLGCSEWATASIQRRRVIASLLCCPEEPAMAGLTFISSLTRK
jgi:hypothetical protein